MSNFAGIQRQLNIDENLAHRVIVRLAERTSNNGRNNEKMKSGLVRISSTNRFQCEDRKLRKDLKFWIPISSQTCDLGNEIVERMRTESQEFYDMDECIQYINSCIHKRVILILSGHHAENKKSASNFIKFSQIIAIYRCMPQIHFEKCLKHWSFGNSSFLQVILPRTAIRTPIKELDEASQLLLMQIFLTEIIVNLPKAVEAKEDFLNFCRSFYKDNPTYMEKVTNFEETYDESNALNWYTRPDSFIFRIVSTTCASLNFSTLFKIRFILRDLYVQLQKLHQEQLETLLQHDLIVYRGKMLTHGELNRLKIKGELFVTRHFLSTAMEEDVATMFSGVGSMDENKISVLIAMHIKRTQMQEKPIAFLGELSQISDENEVMLPMGIVFRTDSYEEICNHSTYTLKINMIRGEDETKIEKNLNQFHLITQTGASCTILGMVTFLKYIRNGEHVTEYCNLMSEALNTTDAQLAEQLSTIRDIQSISITDNVTESTPANTSNANHSSLFTNVVAATILGVVIIIAAIVIPVAVILSSGTKLPATTCPNLECISVLNATDVPAQVLFNYQIESLNFNCSQSLSNLTIILTIPRTYKETHHQQNQTFGNNSMNITWIENPSQIIYTWQLLSNMQIIKESFPHGIEIQFSYMTTLGKRVRNRDTWQIWFQSICGKQQYMHGTY